MQLSVLVLALAFSCTLAVDHWALWKQTYNKQYDLGEEEVRRWVWESNLKKVQQHNLEADLGIHTFTLGMNEFADLTVDEFVKQMNGYNSSMPRGQGRSFEYDPLKDLPTSVDWRTKGYVTGVKDQGQCGSCWAFSATGSLEGQHFAKSKTLVSISEQNLVDCSKKQGNMGCNGGLMDYAFEYIKVNNGIDSEQSYPYHARDQTCQFKAADVCATDTGYVDVKSKSEQELQQAIATVGPISVAIDASHSSFQLYKSGVYNEPRCSQTQLDHGVLAVGYDSDSGKDYYIVKNSWGTRWGNQGYIWMTRNKNNQCGIATASSYPTV